MIDTEHKFRILASSIVDDHAQDPGVIAAGGAKERDIDEFEDPFFRALLAEAGIDAPVATLRGYVREGLRGLEQARAGEIAEAREILAACYREAVAQGFAGGREEWQPTAGDLEEVTGKIGVRPTRAEWRSLGVAWVGGRHAAD